MATIAQSPFAQSPSEPPTTLAWLGQLVRDELAPYPGRLALVARMTIAATLIMLICMTFDLSYGFQGAIYSLLISRESFRNTLQSAGVILFVTVLGTTYLLISVMFVISVPILHFLWIVGTFFVAFYALRIITNYGAASAFAVVLSVVIPLWDRHVSAETNVEDTLRVTFVSLIAGLVTAIVELVSARLQSRDNIIVAIDQRLAAVEGLLDGFEKGQRAPEAAQRAVVRLGMVGTSTLRRALLRAGHSAQYQAQMRAVVSLAGRLVTLGAVLAQEHIEPSQMDQERLRRLIANIKTIRADLLDGRIPGLIVDRQDESSHRAPLLREIEHAVWLIPEAFVTSRSMDESFLIPDKIPRTKLLAPDAFTNPGHLRFALQGCTAASASYIIYNAIAWPGISTAVQTCLLTALSMIGVSRQKQVLRFAGAIVGGFVIGLGAQVFILPYIDSITGFTILFALVTAFSAWCMTSSPRLSYFGLQVALAFYLINLQEFAFQTSLSIARDRVVGILLGLLMMGLVFDRLQGAPAAEMLRTFVSNVRLLAQLALGPRASDLKDPKAAMDRAQSLHDTINGNFDQVTALADSVVLEFGPSRQRDLAMENRIRQAQTQLRMIFLAQYATIQYRLQIADLKIPDEVISAHEEFNDRLAASLNFIADRAEGKATAGKVSFGDSVERLEQAVRSFCAGTLLPVLAAPCDAILSLSQRVASLTVTVENEMTSPL
jgi:multidrug resistance protein MdtO